MKVPLVFGKYFRTDNKTSRDVMYVFQTSLLSEGFWLLGKLPITLTVYDFQNARVSDAFPNIIARKTFNVIRSLAFEIQQR